MFHLVLQRILHKRWMVASLLIGNILLVAIAVSYPMYRDASKRHMLTDCFEVYMEEENTYPMIIKSSGYIRKEAGKGPLKEVREYMEQLPDELGLSEVIRITFRSLVVSNATSTSIHDAVDSTQKLSIASLVGLPEHASILSGRMYSTELAEDGYYEAVISQSAMVEYDLLVGEELEFANVKDKAGDPIHVRIVGVFTNSEEDDPYWTDGPDYYDKHLFIDETIFRKLFMNTNATKYQLNEYNTLLLDYTELRPENVDYVISVAENMVEEYKTVYSAIEMPDFVELIRDYKTEEKQVTVTLSILQVPVIVLLCAFIFMISRQMLEMEENEIALLKSRGASKRQILKMYFYQSAILSGVSFVAGLPLGALVCRILGASSAFLKFDSRRVLSVEYTGDVFLYGLLAVAVSMVMTLLPVFKRDKVSIVAVKRKRSRKDRPLWKKLYLDVIMLAVSLYGLYTFSLQEDEMLVRVLSGKALDPLLFLSSSLFILGAGMFSLRIHGLIVRLIYRVGRSRWQPAEYTSFLQLIRTENKQSFIMVFLVLTVAFGMFNTTVARTILANAENNLDYLNGADIVLVEYWKNNAAYAAIDPDTKVVFTEADFGKYGQLDCEGITRVYRNAGVTTTVSGRNYSASVMAIDTKSFGETTDIDAELLTYDYYDYLNVLSTNPDAILLSMNYHDKLGVKVGDKITYTISGSYASGTLTATVYGFFDYWPGYAPESIEILNDESTRTNENYLIVAHLSTVQEAVGVYPYEIWINMGGDTTAFYEFAEAENLRLNSLTDTVAAKESIADEPLFQGTNGILTMSFITILLICAIGYVIYWMLSIRSRELLFGIFRAMGMTRNEIIRMIINEQAFTGLFGIVFGLVIGWLASTLYVPIIQIAYSAADRVLPLELITQGSDIARLIIIIAAMFLICIAILINQVFRMKISQALKLGED